ncbi:MAG: flavin reductase [Prevotellaceae bacterium]|jgi:flavin reductase (DIM6/NTAB) family NADH-FMN oxidoreductase RutF|nr:flavin reductase [Prevotellaceae bacterium]
MKTFEAIDIIDIEKNIIRLIAKDWMLVTAGTPDKFNTMTANWGGMGFLWNKAVAFIFIRPQRYTFEFIEHEPVITLSFFDEQYREALNICGSKSGRDTDKVKLAGITPIESSNESVSFSEAFLIIEGKKLYAEFLKAESFIDESIVNNIYRDFDFHKLYIVEITKAWIKQVV